MVDLVGLKKIEHSSSFCKRSFCISQMVAFTVSRRSGKCVRSHSLPGPNREAAVLSRSVRCEEVRMK